MNSEDNEMTCMGKKTRGLDIEEKIQQLREKKPNRKLGENMGKLGEMGASDGGPRY